NGHTATCADDQFWWGIVPGITVLNESIFGHHVAPMPPRVIGLDIFGKDQYFSDPEHTVIADTVWSDNRDTFYLKGSFKKLSPAIQRGIEWESLSSNNMPIGLSLPHDQNYLRFH